MTHILKGEYLRLFRTRLPAWAALVALATGAFFPGVIALVGPENATPPMPGLDTPDGVQTVLGLASMTLFIPALLGTLAIAAEYQHRTITTTFVTVPARWKALLAKQLVYATAGLAYGALFAGATAAALLARSQIAGEALGVPPGRLVGLLLGLTVAAAAYTVIGVAVGAIARHPLVAGGIVFGYFYLVEPLFLVVPGVNLIYPVLPGGATAALIGFTYLSDAMSSEMGMSGPPFATALAGAALLFAYGAAASLIALVLPLRRDVT